MELLKNKYPLTFEFKSLISELKYVYIDNDFKKSKTVIDLLKLIIKLELNSAMPETLIFINLVNNLKVIFYFSLCLLTLLSCILHFWQK